MFCDSQHKRPMFGDLMAWDVNQAPLNQPFDHLLCQRYNYQCGSLKNRSNRLHVHHSNVYQGIYLDCKWGYALVTDGKFTITIRINYTKNLNIYIYYYMVNYKYQLWPSLCRCQYRYGRHGHPRWPARQWPCGRPKLRGSVIKPWSTTPKPWRF